MRRNLFLGSLLFISIMTLTSTYAFALDVGISADAYLTNNYFWRVSGIEDPHLQCDLALTASLSDLEISVIPWISYNFSTKDINEVDYILDLCYSLPDEVSVSAGTIYYDVPDIPETIEVYGLISYEKEIAKILKVSPQVSFYYEVKEIKKAYSEIILSLESPLIPFISASSILGYDFGQFEPVDEKKLTTLQLGLSGNFEIIKGLSVTPSFTYVLGLHESIDNTSFAGLKFSFEF